MSARLICGNVPDVLPALGRFKLLVADPPDNIGLGYDGYGDRMPARDYKGLLLRWLWASKCAADVV